MTKKIKIAFMVPEGKWWPYYLSQRLKEDLEKKYNTFDISIFNTKSKRLSLHFSTRYDILISVIPFLFKPVWIKIFVFNPHWNFVIERKNNTPGNKLQYLAERNLNFSDSILLVSKYIAIKIWFYDAYQSKIKIIPNYINPRNYRTLKNHSDEIRLITITSFKFLKKWKWILDIAEVVKILWNMTQQKIIRTIIWNDESVTSKWFMKLIDDIDFSKNIVVKKLWRLTQDQIKSELSLSTHFIYWSYLDNFPLVLLEASASKLFVLTNNFESFKYFIPWELLCRTHKEMAKKILDENLKKFEVSKFDSISILPQYRDYLSKLL